MKRTLLTLAAIVAALVVVDSARAQCCAGRCVRGAGRVAASVGRAVGGCNRGQTIYRSYSRTSFGGGYYVAECAPAYSCAPFGTCAPVGACDPIETVAPAPVVAPCDPVETTAPAPCESVGEYVPTAPTRRVETTTTRRVIRNCPGGICPLF